MKKFLSILIIFALSVSMVACGDAKKEESEAQEPKEEWVTENDTFKLEKICVDDSYRDDDNSPIRMVYLFYTVTAKDANLQIDCKYMNLTINDTNTYESGHFVVDGITDYMTNYYYSSYVEDVYTGTSKKAFATFKIPETDLAPGRVITLEDSQLPGLETIKFSTDELVHYDDPHAMAKEMDPEGYAKIEDLKSDADPETVALVKSSINGYEWSFYVNSTSYKLSFWEDNNFELTVLGRSNSGTYEVKKGYVFCTYTGTGYVVEIPYTFEDGKIDLDVTGAFDVG